MAKTAGIVLIGNEILSGKVADQNALYLCREFRQLGVDVRKIAVVPDEVELIAREVAEFAHAYDWVFTSGGVGPTHDDVTIEGVARAFGIRVVRDPGLVASLDHAYQGRLNDARLKMAEVPEGAELLVSDHLVVPVIVVRNVHVFPGVPEIFRRKFDAIKERFRERPYLMRVVFFGVGEGTLAEHLNAMLRSFPELLCGSYPEFTNPEYKVRVTLESKEPDYLEAALQDLLGRLPGDTVIRVQ
ncbi:MAG TPA: molybdopterin-binding protein [Methylomirabilota bacterium]|jgi:molybdenum cofactor synthesis domain-containing protein|nr:molybdopterin-binding protein [Methylomirabilota bacterium]